MARNRRLRRCCALVSAGVLLLVPKGVLADEVPPGAHFEAALRFGVAFPQIDYFATTLEQTAYPIWLDAGVRIGPLVFVGAYFSFAPTSVNEAFVDAVSPCDINCWARVFHFGLEVQFHPLNVPLGRGVSFDPFLGIGGGYEVQQQRYAQEANGPHGYYGVVHVGARRGPEGNVQVGLALSFSGLSIGPYAVASWGLYTIDAGQPLVLGIGHWWLEVGLRATVTFP